MEELKRHTGLIRIHGQDSSGARHDALPFGAHHEGLTEFSASCVCIAPALFLTSASLLWPFLTESGTALHDRVHLSLLLPSPSPPGPQFSIEPCHLLGFCELSEFDRLARQLVAAERPLWSVGWSLSQRQELAALRQRLTAPAGQQAVVEVASQARILPRRRFLSLAAFAVIAMDAPSRCTASPVSWPKRRAVAGDPVRVVASPYGVMAPRLFCNTIAQGVVANLLGDQGMLVDARVLPGCEGGGVFDADGHLQAVLTSPLSRVDFQPLDLALAASWHALMPQIFALLRHAGFDRVLPPFASSLPRLDHVALVAVDGQRWGSAVILPSEKTGRRLLLTSAHLFLDTLKFPSIYPSSHTLLESNSLSSSPSSSSSITSISTTNLNLQESNQLVTQFQLDGHKIQVRFGGIASAEFHWSDAELLFLSNSHMDVAILALTPSSDTNASVLDNLWRPVSLSDLMDDASAPNALQVGDAVQVIGFGLFGPQSQLPAWVSQGIISEIVPHPEERVPLLLQTTAVVHQGNSGGPLFHLPSGRWCGLITCNSRQRDGLVIPTLNFSISTSALAGPLCKLLTHSPLELQHLDPFAILDPAIEKYLWHWVGTLAEGEAQQRQEKMKAFMNQVPFLQSRI